jgi:hypothetical protein
VVAPLSTNNSLPLVSSSKALVGTPLISKAVLPARQRLLLRVLPQGLLRHLKRVVLVVQALQPSQQQVQQLHRRLHRLPLALLLALVTETF